jgi:hypothetical protein
MPFDELLPPSCPPEDIESGDLQGVYRMLAGAAPTPFDWMSHLRRGKRCPADVDPCRWGSLSLQRTLVAAKKLKKLPNFRSATHVAELDVPSGAGVFKSKKNHIDFWGDTSNDVGTFVIGVKQI